MCEYADKSRRADVGEASAVSVQVCESDVKRSLAGIAASRFAKKDEKNISRAGRVRGAIDW